MPRGGAEDARHNPLDLHQTKGSLA